jgi:hypothetical protein
LASLIRAPFSHRNILTIALTWPEDDDDDCFTQEARDPQEHTIFSVGDMNNAASETHEKDPLAPSQQEKSKLQEENCTADLKTTEEKCGDKE